MTTQNIFPALQIPYNMVDLPNYALHCGSLPIKRRFSLGVQSVKLGRIPVLWVSLCEHWPGIGYVCGICRDVFNFRVLELWLGDLLITYEISIPFIDQLMIMVSFGVKCLSTGYKDKVQIFDLLPSRDLEIFHETLMMSF